MVGRNGSYRMVRHVDTFDAGESLLLSPDGRFLAGDGGLEGATGEGTTVIDLSTGHTRGYPAGRPVGWSPDARHLVVRVGEGTLRILELDTGAVRDLGVYGGDQSKAEEIAFSPDGRQLAVQVGRAIVVVDLATPTAHPLADLGDGRYLAGPGAWDCAGRLAVWQVVGPVGPPLPDARGGRPADFTLTYVDPHTGADARGPVVAPVRAVGARLLGWQSDGDAVVVLYSGHVQVLALRDSAAPRALVSLPGATDRVDIARDLLDRFGGPAPSLTDRLLDWLRALADDLAVLLGIVVSVYGVVMLRRRARTGFWRKVPGGTRRRVDFPRPF